MKIVVGSDHAGDHYKREVAQHLIGKGHDVEMVGSEGAERYDYPLAADLVAQRVGRGVSDMGILICGSGIGMSIRANRYPAIRAALCTSEDMAQLAREHNHANVLCLGERMISLSLATAIVDRFLESQPDNSERHAHRVTLLGQEITP
ncbi:MAG: ribose 5-phosphate isomerase B [Armatimonadetes bacterium]|nr:ribose 5-phosphate isomerase B [Armatimonadota bacterium]